MSKDATTTNHSGRPPRLGPWLEKQLPGLQRFVQARVGARVATKESASDLVQSVCREVLQGLEERRLEYRGEAELKQWLYRAATLKILNRHRFYGAECRDSRREQRGYETQPGIGPGEDLGPRASATPSRQVILQEQLERLRSLLARLSEQDRTLIELAHFQGLGHAEIANRLGICESHSRVQLSRALARLARLGAQELGLSA